MRIWVCSSVETHTCSQVFVPLLCAASPATPPSSRRWQRPAACSEAVWTPRARRTRAWSPNPSCARCCCCARSAQRKGRGTVTTSVWSRASSPWAAPASAPSSCTSNEEPILDRSDGVLDGGPAPSDESVCFTSIINSSRFNGISLHSMCKFPI